MTSSVVKGIVGLFLIVYAVGWAVEYNKSGEYSSEFKGTIIFCDGKDGSGAFLSGPSVESVHIELEDFSVLKLITKLKFACYEGTKVSVKIKEGRLFGNQFHYIEDWPIPK